MNLRELIKEFIDIYKVKKFNNKLFKCYYCGKGYTKEFDSLVQMYAPGTYY